MPITISDTGITGLPAGGLPDATVTTADIVDANITAAKLSGAQTGAAPVYGVRAWCTFNGGATGTNAPTAGGNVTSVTRNTGGDYTINFTVAMPDANYAVTGSAGFAAASSGRNLGAPYSQAPTTTAVRVAVTNAVNTLEDVGYVSVVIYR